MLLKNLVLYSYDEQYLAFSLGARLVEIVQLILSELWGLSQSARRKIGQFIN